MGKHWRWKGALQIPTRQVAETAEGESESSQSAEVKAIQLALNTAEQEEWPELHLYTDSWMVASQEELNQTMRLISETTSKIPGPKSMALSGYIISPLVHQLLGKIE